MNKDTKKPSISVTPRDDSSQFSVDDVIAARLGGQPFGLKADSIPQREPGKYALRIANSLVGDSRHYDMVHRLGYAPFTVEDLPDGVTPQSIGFRVSEDGQTLVRGTRGDEVIYKMPKAAYEQIQMKKAEANTKALRSGQAAREDVAQAAAGALGPEAADYLYKNSNITITDQRGPLTGA